MASGTRDRILEAALELFSEVGFQGTTISEVERRVGLAAGTGSFYRHFPSKEALLQAAVDREVERVRAEMLEGRSALPQIEDPDERAIFMLKLALRDIRRYDRLFRLMLTEGDRVPELGQAITRSLQRPNEQLDSDNDPTTVVVLAALGGYHLFSIMQGHPFQGMSEDKFLALLADLTAST